MTLYFSLIVGTLFAFGTWLAIAEYIDIRRYCNALGMMWRSRAASETNEERKRIMLYAAEAVEAAHTIDDAAVISAQYEHELKL